MSMSAMWGIFLSICLYGSSGRIGNPGKNQHIHVSGAGAQQRPRATLDRGARGQHVVDQHQPPPENRSPALLGYLESPLDIGGALGAGQADLLDGSLDPFK